MDALRVFENGVEILDCFRGHGDGVRHVGNDAVLVKQNLNESRARQAHRYLDGFKVRYRAPFNLAVRKVHT